MRFDHGVAKKSIIPVGSLIKHTAGVSDHDNLVILRGKKSDGRAGSNEFGEQIRVGFEGVSEHESVDLEQIGSGLGLLEKR